MDEPENIDRERRYLLMATSACGVAAGIATAVPFVKSLSPSQRAQALGAPVEIDIAGMHAGEMRITEWRGKPVWAVTRSPDMIADLAKNDAELADPLSKRKADELTPPYARNTFRSIKPETLVVVGICTHLGCSPSPKFQKGQDQDHSWNGGFFCPCHGSTFDMAGRVYKNKPAPDNLEVPPHRYLTDTKILVGDHQV